MLDGKPPADWSPEKIERFERYCAREARRGQLDGRPPMCSIVITREAYETVVKRAIDEIKKDLHEDGDNEQLQPGRAIELICADWLAGRK